MNDTPKYLPFTDFDNFIFVEIKPKDYFTKFKIEDINAGYDLKRVYGLKPSKVWSVHGLLFGKTDFKLSKSGKVEGKTNGSKGFLKIIFKN